MSDKVQIAIVGSVGIDTIETPSERRPDILGGSASYACAAASFFNRTGMVGVVGTDFPQRYHDLYEEFGIDTAGLQVKEGKTFRWSGVYEQNMDNRRTISTDLNVFADFQPHVPEQYLDAPFLFLGNISPALQLHVLDQMRKPRFVMVDTMDLWIEIAHDALLEVIRRVDLLTVNEFEARHLTGERNLLRAAHKLLDMGPEYVIIKKGEHGSMMFAGGHIFILPAYPLESVVDPTGAGDTFAGGFIGSLSTAESISPASIRAAMVHGSVTASFGVEAFSLERLAELTIAQIHERSAHLRSMLHM